MQQNILSVVIKRDNGSYLLDNICDSEKIMDHQLRTKLKRNLEECLAGVFVSSSVEKNLEKNLSTLIAIDANGNEYVIRMSFV